MGAAQPLHTYTLATLPIEDLVALYGHISELQAQMEPERYPLSSSSQEEASSDPQEDLHHLRRRLDHLAFRYNDQTVTPPGGLIVSVHRHVIKAVVAHLGQDLAYLGAHTHTHMVDGLKSVL